jgi:copper chaperone CopZ
MKKIFILLAFLGMFSTGFAQKANDKKEKFATIEIKTSAVCDMCIDPIEGALAYEKGVKKSKLNVKSKIVTVKYNPGKTDPDKIRKAISLAGYDADDVKADPKAYEKLDDCCKKDGCEDK